MITISILLLIQIDRLGNVRHVHKYLLLLHRIDIVVHHWLIHKILWRIRRLFPYMIRNLRGIGTWLRIKNHWLYLVWKKCVRHIFVHRFFILGVILSIRISRLLLYKLCHRILPLLFRSLVPQPIVQCHFALLILDQFLLLKLELVEPLLLKSPSLFTILFSSALFGFFAEHFHHFLPLLIFNPLYLLWLLHDSIRTISLPLSTLRFLLKSKSRHLKIFVISVTTRHSCGYDATIVQHRVATVVGYRAFVIAVDAMYWLSKLARLNNWTLSLILLLHVLGIALIPLVPLYLLKVGLSLGPGPHLLNTPLHGFLGTLPLLLHFFIILLLKLNLSLLPINPLLSNELLLSLLCLTHHVVSLLQEAVDLFFLALKVIRGSTLVVIFARMSSKFTIKWIWFFGMLLRYVLKLSRGAQWRRHVVCLHAA